METKTTITPETHLKTMIDSSFALIEQMRTGKGLGMTPEQQEQYKKIFDQSGHAKDLDEFTKKMNDLTSKYPGFNTDK